MKPINPIESKEKESWESKYFNYLNEAGKASLNPLVNDETKVNTKEQEDKVKNTEGKFTMDSKEAGSYKLSSGVENIASHNYDYSTKVDNINNVNAQEMQNGIYCEVKYNPELTLEEAQEIVIANLAKDPLHYVKDGQFGVKGVGYEEQKISENDGETYGGSGYSEKLKDSENAWQVVKESVKESLNEHLGGVVGKGNPNSIASQQSAYWTQMMEEHGLNDGQVVQEENDEKDLPMDEAKADDDVDEARQAAIEASQEAAGMDVDEAKGKDHDGDGDVDSEDYLAARDKAIKANMAKKKVKKENIDTKLAEIGKAGEITKLEAQLEFLSNHIDEKVDRVNGINEDENLKELIDKSKMKAMQKEIKLLEKRKKKMEKLYEKMCGKAYKRQEVVDEMDAVSWNEKNNPTRSKEVGERDPKKVGKSTSAYAVNQP